MQNAAFRRVGLDAEQQHICIPECVHSCAKSAHPAQLPAKVIATCNRELSGNVPAQEKLEEFYLIPKTE